MVTGMDLPRRGLAGRRGQTFEPQSKAARPLVAPTQSKQKRLTQAATVGGELLWEDAISFPSRRRRRIIVGTLLGGELPDRLIPAHLRSVFEQPLGLAR